LSGNLTDAKVYEDLTEIIENSENNFWGAVKEQLTDEE
jgi:hypothetical protein